MKTGAMVSVSGIRGIVGETLAAEDIVRWALAYATLLGGGRVVVGRDMRPSGEMIRDLLCGALVSAGCDVTDLGIAPTPTVGLMVRHLKARGGIAITASHNPIEWNALKFFRADGALLRQSDHDLLVRTWKSGKFRAVRIARLKSAEKCDSAAELHIARIVGEVDAARIRSRHYRVIADCCNGAGVAVVPGLLEALGCRTTVIFGERAERFGRPPEPLAENLGELSRRVRREKADIGFAVDPDADRLAIVDETGKPIGEERTIALAAYHVLGRRRSPLVVNLSTTRAIDDVGRMRGVRVHRTPVGEAHVVAAMRRRRAIIGGEGNGGVIYPRVALGRDAATAVALILDALAERGETIGALNRRVPDYVMLKKRLPVAGTKLRRAFRRLERHFVEAERIWHDDGLRIDLREGWFHLRPSRTEPIVRLFVEASTAEQAEKLAARVERLL